MSVARELSLPPTEELRALAQPDARQVAEVARATMSVEQSRGEAVRTRAAGLLGSCGVLLTLTVGLGDKALSDSAGLGRVGAPVSAGLAIAGVALLAAAALLASLVFAPSRRVVRTPMEAVRAFADVQFRTADAELLAAEAQHFLAEARAANLVRGRRLLLAIGVFTAGVVSLAIEAAIVGISRF